MPGAIQAVLTDYGIDSGKEITRHLIQARVTEPANTPSCPPEDAVAPRPTGNIQGKDRYAVAVTAAGASGQHNLTPPQAASLD